MVMFAASSNVEAATASLQKSFELVGVKMARMSNLEGQGIKIGVIDTGIDFNHPDLFGFGPSGKVVGGYDYVNSDQKPLDTNGHGTEVAGIIAADGNLTGIAPKSDLLAYKVSSTGEEVSSDFIVKAIHQAVQDRVRVINISLGINRTNDEIDNAINTAVKNGVVVVVAAGNNGPGNGTIGSPGKDIHAITVGATYNNLTSSLAATFQVENKQYQVYPMIGSKEILGITEGRIVYGGYGRPQDLQNIDVKNAIILEERGSNVAGQKVYFAEKEKNAADRGAAALAIFNNDTGMFVGELVDPNKNSSYVPRIPVISMSGEDGMVLKSVLHARTTGTLGIFFHPDFVAPFSSQGPVSPFYIKPDLVAPGVLVNTTTLGGRYNESSGTSFAAPHVAGAAALLLQKFPTLTPSEVASLLVTTTDPVTDAYGKPFPIAVAGSGRLNITRALESNLVFNPHSLIFYLSLENTSQTETLRLKTLDGSPIPTLKASFSSQEHSLNFGYSQSNDTLSVRISYSSPKEGDYDGFLILNDSKSSYRIPVVTHVTKGALHVEQRDGILYFSLDYPEKWNYAKISLIRAGNGDLSSTSITPGDDASLPVYQNGTYWVLAEIADSNKTDDAYQTVLVSHAAQFNIFDTQNIGIPATELIIISAIMILTATVGLVSRRKKA